MNSTSKILVVEDKSSEREALARVLRLEDDQVAMASGYDEAMAYLEEPVHLVVSDLRMRGKSGIDLLRLWKEHRPRTPFIMVTAYGEVDSAVEAMKLGAEDYLNKPVNPEELLVLVGKCLEVSRKDETIEHLQQRLDERLGFETIVGKSKAMLSAFDQARRAALVDSTVLVTGESGTGKELIAEAIHQNSPRKDGPFITVNMAAVPENLVESELFGHVEGAFTGATSKREGRFEAANSGTIFIDEIGDFALTSQAKLLRVLESRCVTPIGSNDDRAVDVRVVAATSRDLADMVKQDEFREDLYYRLNVITIQLPPLRERRDDIPLLVSHFLNELSETVGKPDISIDPGLMRFLQAYAWPGNVRQLGNCLESMVVLARHNTLIVDGLPATIDAGPDTKTEVEIPAGTSLQELERTAVERSLEEHGGNRTHAAQSLGISVRTLQRKLKAWGIDEEGGEPDGGVDADHDEDSCLLSPLSGISCSRYGKPRSRWRTQYQGWPALKKLTFVDQLMSGFKDEKPKVTCREHVDSVRTIKKTLREHYKKKRAHYGLEYPDFYYRDLKQLFSTVRKAGHLSAARFVRQVRNRLREDVSRWTSEHPCTIDQVLTDMIRRCRDLKLYLDRSPRAVERDLLILVTVQTMNFLHGGHHRVAL